MVILDELQDKDFKTPRGASIYELHSNAIFEVHRSQDTQFGPNLAKIDRKCAKWKILTDVRV